MDGQAFLRTTKIGGGFEKKDVLAYVDELNTKIYNLENQLKESQEASDAGGVDMTVVRGLEDDVKNLRAQLDEEKEKSFKLQGVIEQQNTKIDELNAKYEELENQSTVLSADLNSDEATAELMKKIEQQEFLINDKDDMLESKSDEIKKVSDKLIGVESELRIMAEKLSDKDNQIKKLNTDLEEAKRAKAAAPVANSFDISGLFVEAQNTANKITIEAQKAADKLVADAKSNADETIANAKQKADSIVSEAMKKADDEIKENTANAKEALRKAAIEKESVTKVVDKVKDSLKTEVDGVSLRIDEIAKLMEKITVEVNDRIKSAKNMIASTKDSIVDSDEINELVAKLPDITSADSIHAPVMSMPEPTVKKHNEPSHKKMNAIDFGADLEALTKAIEANAESENEEEVIPVKKLSPMDFGADLEALTRAVEEEANGNDFSASNFGDMD